MAGLQSASTYTCGYKNNTVNRQPSFARCPFLEGRPTPRSYRAGRGSKARTFACCAHQEYSRKAYPCLRPGRVAGLPQGHPALANFQIHSLLARSQSKRPPRLARPSFREKKNVEENNRAKHTGTRLHMRCDYQKMSAAGSTRNAEYN